MVPGAGMEVVVLPAVGVGECPGMRNCNLHATHFFPLPWGGSGGGGPCSLSLTHDHPAHARPLG